jgi:hypothetical protein
MPLSKTIDKVVIVPQRIGTATDQIVPWYRYLTRKNTVMAETGLGYFRFDRTVYSPTKK